MRNLVIVVEYRFEVEVMNLYLDDCIIGDIDFLQREIILENVAVEEEAEVGEQDH